MNTSSDHLPSSAFVAKIDLKFADKLLADLRQQGFDISTPPYTVFSAKKKGVSCTLYQSGKLMVQGKEMKPFLEFYLEPEILGSFQYSYPDLDLDIKPRIGIDESGKGDFFGPLCIAGVFAGGEEIKQLKALGVKDSKALSDNVIRKIASKICAQCVHHIVKINPLKYNELYTQFHNLNRLLAWGHATAIEQLILKTKCEDVIIDQFADEHVVITALQRKKLKPKLTQRHRAEEDLVVAAASILARSTFLEGLEKLKQQYGMEFPKGASKQTIDAAKRFVEKYGREALSQVSKLHFKTLDSI
jgi:ribonuclease HIII